MPMTSGFPGANSCRPSRSMPCPRPVNAAHRAARDRKSTRLNSSHVEISYAVFCLKKKNMVERDPVLLRKEKKRAPAEFPEGVRSPTMPTGFPVETTVDSRPIPVNSPRPNYTEDARANGVEGFVKLRALVGAGGSVTDVRLLLHLPDGLDEEAILAVKQMRFKAAMKDNQPIAYWVTLEVDFNLCNRCVPVTPK